MKQYPSRVGVGASSILLIVVVLSLTLFAVLSLVQARADAALTDRTALSASAFYDADARAQQMLALIDDALAADKSPATIEGITQDSAGTISFSIGSFDGHALNVVADTSGGRCSVTSYRYVSTAEWIGQSAETLWQGE